MATITSQCISDTHILFNSWSTGTTTGSNGTTNHGNEQSYLVGFEFQDWGAGRWNQNRYEALLQFNVAAIIPQHRITRVRLVQNRHAVTGAAANLRPSIRPFIVTSGAVNIERRVTWNNFSTMTQFPQGSRITGEPNITGTGEIQTDITTIFDPNHIQDGIYSLHISASAGLYSHRSREFAATNPRLIIETQALPSQPPTSLQPTTAHNPRAPITLSWWHTPNPLLQADDPQTASEITVWQDGQPPIIFTAQDDANTITLPANTFENHNPVYFRVRTQTQHNGWGAFSAITAFPLSDTPPLAPQLIYPINISVTGSSGVLMEWAYNSPYDTIPGQFDIRYRIDGGPWNLITNYSQDGNPARTTAITQAIDTQARVEWQVKAYGELLDPGPWSDIAVFFTIGAPRPPTIVSVTNSNRPTINFSATNLMSWEAEIHQAGQRVYASGNRPFLGEFRHVVNQFLPMATTPPGCG